ncbi:MAG: HAMP domain-containing histidine kinase [Gammaproteobacteria bacterium]|nr:HAMP domain-containing histidine kinase [Gammaproteobacteria bacterium]
MNKNIINVLFVIIAVGVLSFLYIKSSEVDNEAYVKNLYTLRDLQRADANWTAETLKKRTSLSSNFDAMAAASKEVEDFVKQIGGLDFTNSDLSNTETVKAFEALVEVVKNKRRLVERFKSAQAVMHNSVRYLPVSGNEVLSSMTGAKKEKSHLEINVFLNDVYTYILSPEASKKEELLQQLGVLKAKVTGGEKELSNSLSRFTNHVNVILQRHVETEQLLNRAVSQPTVSAINKVIEQYDLVNSGSLEEAGYYQMALVVFSALMLGLIVFFAYRLTQSYRALNKANAKLYLANHSLEAKVDDRTKQLKESQSHLVQSEKMAAIGQMVAGVAHEINTPLGYVLSNVEMVGDMVNVMNDVSEEFYNFTEAVKDPALSEDDFANGLTRVTSSISDLKETELLKESNTLLDDAKYGLGQISEIVLNLKDFSRMDRSTKDKFDINKGLESTLKIANNILKNTAKVTRDFSELPEILCAPSQINQVLLNVITNAAHAIDATDNSGVIAIKTRADKDNVYISIKDNGCGMSEDVQAHVFDAFYTTKDVGKGTGLGMSISHKIIEAHAGEIRLASKPGVGTHFLIQLPIKPISEVASSEAA